MITPHRSIPATIEPVVSALRVAGGVRLEDAGPGAIAMTPPPRVARGREGERLLVLLDLVGPASPHLYRELREALAQTYWSTTGSITAALRRAAAAANGHLLRANLRSAPAGRCNGHLLSAALHGDDLFILQAGSARACFLRGEYLVCFSRAGEPPPLGRGPLADVRLYHTFVAQGDTLLLSSSTLIREVGDAGLARVLSLPQVPAVQEGLEQVGAGADFTALVARWAVPEEPPPAREARRPSVRARREPSQPPARFEPQPPSLLSRPEPRPEPQPSRPAPRVEREPRLPAPRAERESPPRPERRVHPRPTRRPGPTVGARLAGGGRAVGRGMAAAGGWVAGGVSTLFRSMLPGPGRQARRRARAARPRPARAVPKENRTAMMLVAVAIPVALAIAVALAYLSLGAEARVRGFINQAQGEVTLAQAVPDKPEEARPHWEAAWEQAGAALALRPDDPVATTLQSQARTALDLLDGIVRLQPVRLWDFGPGSVPRRLVVHGQTAFVLDPAGGWVAQLTLNPTGDGVIEQGDAPIPVRTGQRLGEGEVGDLVDLTWVSLGGERQTSGLLILEQDGALINYDPAWVDEGGISRLMRSFLGTSPASPRSIGSYGGRLYVLDTGDNQVWRYDARGDTYPERPDRYFVAPPPKSLAGALDMAINGHVYVLYRDGSVLQFLQGEHQPAFNVHGLPDAIVQAVALAVDPDGDRGAVYVADRGGRRVVVLGPDGAFQAQLQADRAFDALEALAVDEAARRLYVVSGGTLLAASLP